MTELRKAAEMALEALETLDVGDSYKTHNAASALRQALAQDALQKLADIDHSLDLFIYKTEKSIHEPVAWMKSSGLISPYQHGSYQIPLYTAPPKKEWVGLTDADIAHTMRGSVEGSNMLPYQFARTIEAKLKEKNSA